MRKEYNRIFIFMLPKPKIWKICVYGPISKIFWDLILPRWIIRIVFYKIVCHIIFSQNFCLSQRVKFQFILFSFFVTDQAEQTTQVSMWLKKWTWTGSRTKKCEIRIWSVSDVCVGGRSECRQSTQRWRHCVQGMVKWTREW